MDSYILLMQHNESIPIQTGSRSPQQECLVRSFQPRWRRQWASNVTTSFLVRNSKSAVYFRGGDSILSIFVVFIFGYHVAFTSRPAAWWLEFVMWTKRAGRGESGSHSKPFLCQILDYGLQNRSVSSTGHLCW